MDFGTPESTSNSYPSKIDLHQLGGGFNEHFYFTHTRSSSTGYASQITGTWTLGHNLNQWARVFIHTPDHAGWTQLLTTADSAAVARAWFMGMNPHLNDETPAEVLADGRTREVLAAARAFIDAG
ncbi:MAG: hydrolase family protein [Mycetocola sp.]|nr:hydrolase family protein [Mycetocola sp.]